MAKCTNQKANLIRPLGLAPSDQLAADDDAALGEAHLLPDLQHLVPARLAQSRRDELGAGSLRARLSISDSPVAVQGRIWGKG